LDVSFRVPKAGREYGEEIIFVHLGAMIGVWLRGLLVHRFVGSRNNQQAFGHQNPNTLVKEDLGPWDVLDRLERNDHIDGVAWNRNGVGIPGTEDLPVLVPRSVTSLPREIHPYDAS
jgi:hypothetical protein